MKTLDSASLLNESGTSMLQMSLSDAVEVLILTGVIWRSQID
jgi:hypothetical protein